MKLFNKIRLTITGLVTALACLALAGCSHPKPVEAPLAPPNRVHIQQNLFKILKNQGVGVFRERHMVALELPTSMLFIGPSAQLSSNAFPILNRIVGLMRTYSIVTVRINGYSATGRPSFAAQQAQAVQRYLWDKGVNVRIMVAGGYRAMGTRGRIVINFRYYQDVK